MTPATWSMSANVMFDNDGCQEEELSPGSFETGASLAKVRTWIDFAERED